MQIPLADENGPNDPIHHEHDSADGALADNARNRHQML